MADYVGWHVELAVIPGALEAFRELTAEMVAATRGEPNVLIYERFVSADGSVVHVHERYTDSAAAMAHLRTFGRVFSRRFASLVDRTRFIVYGTPTAELREILDGFGATYFFHFAVSPARMPG